MTIDVKTILNSGLVGSTGATGFTGATGATGIDGASGATGITGASGINGASGFVGSNGATGTQGDVGATGATGTAGVNGATGSTGPTGATGATGPKGDQGTSSSSFNYSANTSATAGYPGDGKIIWNNATQNTATQISVSHLSDGTDIDIYLSLLTVNEEFVIQKRTSSSDYQVWKIAGTPTNTNPGASNSYWNYPVSLISYGGVGRTNFTDNENLFLAIVNGVTGPTGATGVQGASGSTGLTGASGATGTQGASGVQGASGINGATGSTGPTGATGTAGTNGATGSTGPAGATGVAGVNGATGSTGPAGATGLAQGLQTIWVPTVSMLSRTTNGPGSTTTESATNKVVLRTLDFDTATQEFAQFTIRMPKSWDEGTIRFQPYWTAAAASGGVTWGLQGIALSDNDAIDTAFGTAQVTSDTLLSNTAVHAGPTSIPITVGGTPLANDVCIFQVFRQVANTNDTIPADARLLGISIFYTINTADDV